MINPNEEGIIYYGTDFQYINDLDKNGLTKPRKRDEQYISVSISGYKGKIKCEHPELREMARVFSSELKIAALNDGYLFYKPGYENTISYQHGFGPNPNEYHHSFFGLVKNTRTINTITLVISKKAQKYLVIPDKSHEFEYLSTALHGFIERINQEDILGWIVSESHVSEVKKQMEQGILIKRQVWSDKDFNAFQYEQKEIQRYGCFPSDISMYLNGVSKDSVYKGTRIEHLKRILEGIVKIDWESDFESELTEWLKNNETKIKWNSNTYKYELNI